MGLLATKSDYESDDDCADSGDDPQILKQEHDLCLDSPSTDFDAISTTKPIMITAAQVLEIEIELELYEKISLVYLLYDDPKVSLNEAQKLVNGNPEKIFYNWAIHQNLMKLKWQEKFIEALAIIQNYHVLVHLGFQKEDIDLHFFPRSAYISNCILGFRKTLYLLVCEELIKTEIEAVLHEVHADFQAKRLQFEMFDTMYLELFLLHWEVLEYVQIGNVGNLCSVLKRMERFDLSDRLKAYLHEQSPSTETESGNNHKRKLKDKTKTVDSERRMSGDIYDEILRPESNLLDLISLQSDKSHVSADNAVYVNDDNKYNIDPNNPGMCLIINQENFYREVDPKFINLLPDKAIRLDERLGTEKDRNMLEWTFKRFGFKIEIINNLIHTALIAKIEETLTSITDESSLFICILSHGDEGVVYGSNSCKVSVKKIQNLMCSKNRNNLLGKPKVLILQSCQGNRCQRVMPIEEEEEDDITIDGPCEVVPPKADLFTFWATVPGFGAIRNKKTGTWFIQSLCEKMKELGNKYHFEDICTMVNLDVSRKKCIQKKEEVAMVPLKETTLRKLLYLPPMKT